MSKLSTGEDVTPYLPVDGEELSINKIVGLLADEDVGEDESPQYSGTGSAGGESPDSPITVPELDLGVYKSGAALAAAAAAGNGPVFSGPPSPDSTISAAQLADAGPASVRIPTTAAPAAGASPAAAAIPAGCVSPKVLTGASPAASVSSDGLKHGGRMHIPGKKPMGGHVHHQSSSASLPYDLDEHMQRRRASQAVRNSSNNNKASAASVTGAASNGGGRSRTRVVATQQLPPITTAALVDGTTGGLTDFVSMDQQQMWATPTESLPSGVTDEDENDAGFVLSHLDAFGEVDDLNSNLDELWLGGVPVS